MRIAAVAAAASVLALAACTGEAPAPEAESTEVPADLASPAAPAPNAGESIGTPMAERVATLGLINKRNNISRELEMKPGESRRVDDVVIRLSACERTAPWEEPAETGAFVQVLVSERPDADSEAQWNQVFSGWLFRNSPSLNVVEHPVYDVWVKDCAMSFPGEDAPVRRESGDGDAPARRAAPAAPAAPAPEPAPAAAASPSSEA